MKSLADFKRLAVEGTKFNRRCIFDEPNGSGVPDRIVQVVIRRSNAIVIPPSNAMGEVSTYLDLIRDNPEKYGSWFYFPKASECKFVDDEMIVIDFLGREYIAFKLSN